MYIEIREISWVRITAAITCSIITWTTKIPVRIISAVVLANAHCRTESVSYEFDGSNAIMISFQREVDGVCQANQSVIWVANECSHTLAVFSLLFLLFTVCPWSFCASD